MIKLHLDYPSNFTGSNKMTTENQNQNQKLQSQMQKLQEENNKLLRDNALLYDKHVKLSTKSASLSNLALKLCRNIQQSQNFDKLEYKEVIDNIINLLGHPNMVPFTDGVTGYYWQVDALKNGTGYQIMWDGKKKLWLTVPRETEDEKN